MNQPLISVKIMYGKHKNKIGILHKTVFYKKNNTYKIFVKNLNIVKKHTKGDLQKGISGKIVNKEARLHYSNILFLDK